MTRSLFAAALLLAAACSPEHWSPPPPPPEPPAVHAPALGYQSSMALALVGDAAKLYVPTAIGGEPGDIAVVDAGVAGRGTRGAGALLRTITLGGGDYATLVGGDERVLLAASADFPRAWIIDPATDAVRATIPLDGLGFSAFGGRDAYVTGAIVDPDRNRAWLAVWNGFLAIDLELAARVPAEDVLAAPSEAPGYDPVRGLIFSTFYGCADAHGGPAGSTPPPCDSYTAPGAVPMTAGLDVIRVSDGARFTLQRPGAAAALPVGLGPDSIAIDATAGVGVVADEDSGAQLVLDLTGLTLDAATHTAQLASESAYRAIDGWAYTATAADPKSGAVLMTTEFSSEMVLGTSAELRAGVAPIRLEMPLLPVLAATQTWAMTGDPHGTAIFHLGARRYAFLVDITRRWLARIDLDALDAVSPANPAVLSAMEMAPAVSYLDLTRAP